MSQEMRLLATCRPPHFFCRFAFPGFSLRRNEWVPDAMVRERGEKGCYVCIIRGQEPTPCLSSSRGASEMQVSLGTEVCQFHFQSSEQPTIITTYIRSGSLAGLAPSCRDHHQS